MKHISPLKMPIQSVPFLQIAAIVLCALLLTHFPIGSADGAPGTTAISPTGGTGSPASLGTTITSGSSTVPSNLCTANCVITGGTRSGSNLYHSFGDFNVGALDGARFQTGLVNPVPDASVANILGRITGGNPSSIFGNINSATYYPSANLFLMNPYGFLFGPNASVNVGGMMTFTTANYLKHVDGLRFNAVPDPVTDALLSTMPVAAFGFIGSNPAAINFEGGQLTVAEGTGLTIVGGNISLMPDSSNVSSSITASGRPIVLTSVAGPGEVAVTGIPAAGMALGTVTLGQGTTLSTASDLSFGDGSGGAISIRGGQLVATGATILTNPAFGSPGQGGAVTVVAAASASFSDTLIDSHSDAANGGGGAVSLSASDLTLERTTIMTGVFGDGITPVTGGGGAVSLSATNGTLSLTDSSIDTSGFFAAGAGAVNLSATENVALTRSTIHTDVISPISSGNSGGVSVVGSAISLEDSFISAQVTGDGLTQITASSGAVTLSGTSSVSLVRSSIITDSFETEGNSGAVTITAPTVALVGDPTHIRDTTITSGSHNFSGANAGNGGDITITATGTNATFTLARLESTTEGLGGSNRSGGTVRINGAQGILLDNETNVVTSTNGPGKAGEIELIAPTVTIRNKSVLSSSTFSSGAAGVITLTGTTNVLIESGSTLFTLAEAGSLGPAGEIAFNTPQFSITGGSKARSETFTSSPGGTITVQGINGPAQSILISDANTGLFTNAHDTGSGGNISINSNSVTIQNGGTLSATTSGPASTATGGVINVKANTVNLNTGGTMTAASTGTGASGEVIVQGLASPANSVLIDGSGSGIFTTTSGTGAGGNIFVNGNAVNLQNGARISSSSTGTGAAGNINITAGSQFTMTGSAVTTEANQSSGGAIKITTNPDGTVLLTNSLISASVLDGTGGGGSVNIDPQFVILQNSQILANSVFGPGGNIFITTNLLLPDSLSVISASSQFGQQGTITIQSPISPASGKLNPISSKPLIPASLVNQRCAALAGGNISSFTVAGRDTLPAEPSGWLSSPLALGTLTTKNGPAADSESMTPLLSLRQIAPAGFLTQMFAMESGCQS